VSARRRATFSPHAMSDSKPLIDPKELTPAITGLAFCLVILVFFYLLASTLGMPLFAETWLLPRQ
jgi:hypothetical protein